VGTYPGWPLAAEARGNLLCATFTNPSQPEQSRFATVDISNPATPVTLASLNSVCGVGLCLEGPYAFTSGRTAYEPMRIVSIADSTSIAVVGELRLPPSGEGWGVWADLSRNQAYVAWDGCGLQVVDISSITTPILDTALLVADMAVDVSVDGNRAYVADSRAGLRILDITDPARPAELGARDTMGIGVESVTAVARDSFAFLSWRYNRDQFRTILVSDPSRPLDVASLTVPSRPEDMVLRDTLVYAAGNQRFYVVNVARPREPRLVGSCVLPGYSGKMDLQGNIAYVTNNPFSLVDVANPSSPVVVGSYGARIQGVDVVDTILYGAGSYTGLLALSVSNPAIPYALDSLHLSDTIWWSDVVVIESLAYIGGERLWAVNVSDPRSLRLVTGCSWTPPYLIQRMEYAAPYIYAVCLDAGVCILEPVQLGIADSRATQLAFGHLKLSPNPAGRSLTVRLAPGSQSWSVRDVTGRQLLAGSVRSDQPALKLNLESVPAGVYILELMTPHGRSSGKVVKR
jgi:hypothetical protein